MNDSKINQIKKLFALGSSSNEHEAQAAILKAQEIMARHGLTMDDVDASESEVEQVISSEVENFRNNQARWRVNLASILSEGFKCKSYLVTRRNADTNWVRQTKVVFVGYETDVLILKEVYTNACQLCHHFALSYSVKERGRYQSFVLGFLNGVKDQLNEQSRALMVVVPQEVTKFFDNIVFSKKRARSGSFDQAEYGEAYNSGKRLGRDAVSGKRYLN